MDWKCFAQQGLYHLRSLPDREFHNLEKFVANGGTIVFDDANTFCVHVNYDPANAINLGIFGNSLVNSTSFFEYYDQNVLPIAYDFGRTEQ